MNYVLEMELINYTTLNLHKLKSVSKFMATQKYCLSYNNKVDK